MLTAQEGEAACPDIQQWANRIARQNDGDIAVQVFFDADSNTYVLRLAKESRVLVFRLSVAQVRGSEREAECERTLQRKLKDLRHLI